MVKPFREGLFNWPLKKGEEVRLKGSKCNSCGRPFFPSRVICPFCYEKGGMEPVLLSRQGKLETFSVVRQPGLRYPVPYVVAYISLPEKLRVFAQIEGCSPEDLKIGEEMEMVLGEIRTDENGDQLVGYKFKPVSK